MFLAEAEAEMMAAARYYEQQQTNLGKRFISSVQEAVARLALNPEMYPIIYSNVRRCLARTFPFGILFRVRESEIQIIAVMHLHRDPNSLKNR
ncbi:MAG: type II toxin-antitoxin system RelE/ParE family toxin [Kiritimatiellae bacterium]|nr:type II toxin-antitoxin system RelE/ParE family toxin [Kiritimatiellia bacterium]